MDNTTTSLTAQVQAAYSATACTERDVLGAMLYLAGELDQFYRGRLGAAARAAHMTEQEYKAAEASLRQASQAVHDALWAWPDEARTAESWGASD